MSSEGTWPNFVSGISAAGVEDLRAIAGNFADWQLSAPIDTALTTAEALAAEYLSKLRYPHHIFGELSEDAQDRAAAAVGCPTRAQWQPPESKPGTPAYAEPSWEDDVYEVLFKQLPPEPPRPRPVSDRTSAASQWPELAEGAVSDAALRHRLALELAGALGADWSPVPDVGDAVVRVRFERGDLNFVVVPGGQMTMGMTEAELAELDVLGDEVAESAEFFAAHAAPAHSVTVEPFLCAETPLLARHAAILTIEGDDANVHGVLRQNSWQAAATVAACGLRLPSEAEWEWVARDGGRQSWICGAERPEVWTERILNGGPDEARTPFGTLMLGWGEWVDDGWHDDYVGAPSDSGPWGPVDRPDTVRGGAFACWPWQGGGEALLLHAASRDRGFGQAIHAVRLATDLPPR
ncbi:MAG: hypothetical protein EKK34_14695 [Mycobacterium sp.]|nr:MAG: hypothetical protein EKK34_14695 [Mycobacterium sp.]